MTSERPLTLLCLACYFKGAEFLRQSKRLGHRVYLVTSEHLRDEQWPRESIDEMFFAPMKDADWDLDGLMKGVSHLASQQEIDRIVPLDDFDLEKAARLREHLRLPGMGDSQTRFFRDKLAMRMRASEKGIPVPEFIGAINRRQISQYASRVSPPWLLKPRSQASATGIKKLRSEQELWEALDNLGDLQSSYVLERFVPGQIFHVDSVVFDDKIQFARVHQYVDPPMAVAHEGGIFASFNVRYGSENEKRLQEVNGRLLEAMGMREGVSHTEFILSEADGEFYFLETAARVGGANIAELIEASSGINLWAEWAKIETLRPGEKYLLPEVRRDYSGIIITLARQERPDMSSFDDPEIVWRMEKHHHAGLIVRASGEDRVRELLAGYTERFRRDFHASFPLPDKPTA